MTGMRLVEPEGGDGSGGGDAAAFRTVCELDRPCEGVIVDEDVVVAVDGMVVVGERELLCARSRVSVRDGAKQRGKQLPQWAVSGPTLTPKLSFQSSTSLSPSAASLYIGSPCFPALHSRALRVYPQHGVTDTTADCGLHGPAHIPPQTDSAARDRR